VTFSTTDADPGVVLPADYTFTLGDGGVHTFTDTGMGETTLITPGDQVLTVMDTADNTIIGSAFITVAPAPSPAPGHGAVPAALAMADMVWLPAWSLHHGSGSGDPLAWDWLDGADLLPN
jgi:hypothetical protein